MPNQNPSDRYYSDGYNARPVNRTSARPANNGYAARPSGQRPAGQARPTGSRPTGTARPGSQSRPGATTRPAGTRSAGSRPSASARPDSRYGSTAPRNNPPRRPQKKRRKAKGRFYAFIALAVILVIALVLIIAKPFGGKEDPVKDNPGTTTAANVQNELDKELESLEAEATEQPNYNSLAAYLADEDAEIEGLSEDEMAKVSNLSINQNLPEDWMNILLLGTDERTMKESARTDTMIICSINKNTGEVKLTSLMRDLNVKLDNIGKYSGEYRLNAAHYFGGANLAMKTINECFGMNIQYYVRVNFFGFQKIAQALGGIEISITEAEMKEINKRIVEQYRIAKKAGIDESDQVNEKLTEYGDNIHLNGRQTLAYARIRKTDNDYERTRRQRTVLNELLKKAKELNIVQLTTLAASMMDQVKTNMKFDDIINIAAVVLNNGLEDIESMRLPVNGTYKEEKRNDDSRLWDCDWQANELALYNFIYE